MSRKQTPESFWARVDIRGEDECWPWTGACNSSGYGNVGWHGVVYTAHRVAAWLTGMVPTLAAPKDKTSAGFVLHQCDNPPCCNPKHFRLGTFSQNQKESYDRKRRAQPKGSAHANAKLTNAQVRNIRAEYVTGRRQVDLAAEHGVSQRVISLVVRGETYTNV